MKRFPLLLAMLAMSFCNLFAQIPWPNPTGYYPFNSTFRNENDVTDTAGRASNVGFSSDIFGNSNASSYFNGNSSMFIGKTMSTSDAEMTWSMVVLPYSNLQQTGLIQIGSSTSNGFGISLKKANTSLYGNNLFIYAGGRYDQGDTSIHLTAFRWHHIVFTKRHDTLTLYLDNRKVISRVIGFNAATSPVYIGTTTQHIQLLRSSFHGVIDEVMLWNEAIDSTAIDHLYRALLGPRPTDGIGVIRGRVYMDANLNCSADSAELPLTDHAVVLNPGNYVVPLNPDGSFSVPVQAFQSYSFSILEDRYLQLDSLCAPTIPVGMGDTVDVVLGAQAQPCYKLNVSVGSTARRRCFKTFSTTSVQNLGIHPSQPTRVTLVYPNEVEATAFSVQPDTIVGHMYQFPIPAIEPGGFFRIYTTDSTACRDSITGNIVCTKAYLGGYSDCRMPPANWDGADLLAKAYCGDSLGKLWLTLRNQGQTMQAPTSVRIVANDGVARVEALQLAAGDSIAYLVEDHGEMWQIEAAQTPGHPFGGSAVAAYGGCDGTIWHGQEFLWMGTNIGDDAPNFDMDCMPIIDSYDPNDKLVTPAGLGPDHIVAPKTRLEYKIRFQNKGTASTVFVTVRDTLSSNLDVTSFERGTESHFGAQISTYKFGDKYIVQWRFPSLELTPESVNDAASQGFVTFRISPVDNLALGTEVANKAGIFFDYNRPVVTEPVKVKFDNLPVTTVPNPVVEPVAAKKRLAASRLVMTPNPAHGTVSVSMKGAATTEKVTYAVRDVIGRTVLTGTLSGRGGSISLTGLHKGIYMVSLKAGNASETQKLIVE